MNRPDDHRPEPGPDRDLARLVSDAVSDVEPSDRLAELHARTAATGRRRPWLLATGGAVVAAAAVVTIVALAGGGDVPSTSPGPAARASSSQATESGTVSSAPSGDASGASHAVAVYYLGDTPAGVRLYREFRPHTADALDGALDLLGLPPTDPDYRTGWQPGQLLSAGFDGVGADGEISVEVDPAVRERPEGMGRQEATAAVQQVVYSLQAAVQARAPVRFYADGDPIDQVLGVPTTGPVTEAPALETLALVNLTTPEEGATVSGGNLAVEGVANSNEANVPWRLVTGGETVMQGHFTAEGWMGNRLFPFSGDIDVSSLDPGSYSLIVETDDPTGGAEGTGAMSDSRTIVLE